MKKYTFTAPIEIRGTSALEKDPEYVVKGYINANIPDHYGTKNTPFGKQALRSVFTDNALASMERQAIAKKIYVDSEHKIATQMNVEHYLDQTEMSNTDKKRVLNEIKVSDMPIAKLVSLKRDPANPGRVIADTRLNPHYRNVDENHQKYFDAVWNSMQDKYINGMSFDFTPTKVFEKDGIKYIDDIQLYGINYLGGQALPENNLFEVAMRATKEFEGDETMNEKIEQMEKKLNETNTKLEEANKTVAGFQAKEEETVKAGAQKEKDDLKASVETMKAELEEIKKGTGAADKPTDDPAKKEIKSEDKYNTQGNNPDKLPSMEELEAIKKFKDILWDNVKVKNRFPTHEDMFKGSPMRVNPEGELNLGHLLYLQHEQPELFDQTIEGMDSTQKSALFGMSNAFRHISK